MELSVGLVKFSLKSGPEWLNGLILNCNSYSFAGEALSRKFSISVLSFSFAGSVSTSVILFCFLFLSPFITPVKVRGDTFENVSSSSHDPCTLVSMHNLVMVAGCGMSPLLFVRWYPLIEPSIKPPTFIL